MRRGIRKVSPTSLEIRNDSIRFPSKSRVQTLRSHIQLVYIHGKHVILKFDQLLHRVEELDGLANPFVVQALRKDQHDQGQADGDVVSGRNNKGIYDAVLGPWE